MKVFTNKKTWQKIIIIIIMISFFQLVMITPVHAGTGVLLEPITNLLSRLGDGLINILHKTFMDMEASGVWIEDSGDIWVKILVVLVAIIAATVAVASIVVSGGASLIIATSAIGAVIKIAGISTVAYLAVDYVNLGDNGFFLPEYHLTPQAIFKDEILIFDVNFFNPKEPVDSGLKVGDEKLYSLEYEYVNASKQGEEGAYKLDEEEYNGFKEKYGFYDDSTGKIIKKTGKTKTFYGKNYEVTLEEREWMHLGNNYKVYYAYREGKEFYIKGFRKVLSEKDVEAEKSIARDLQDVISAWYTTFRDIALLALMSVLVYIGIRITLSSVSSDKAKYKEMLGDWLVALCLVFIMHYIMSFACTINSKIIDALSSITIASYGGDKEILGDGALKHDVTTQAAAEAFIKQEKEIKKDAGVQLFVLSGNNAQAAKEQLIGKEGEPRKTDENGRYVSGKNSRYYNRFYNEYLFWPVNDFMGQARMKGQLIDVGADGKEENKNQTAVARAGYNIIYIVLVLYTLYFCCIYLKRVVYMAFLTMIAPLVAITYPIDKLNDGQAQAFNLWFREYIFNLLMQPMHLILYTVLIGMAMRFAATNIFYTVVAMGFLLPAEKLLRSFFGFEKAQTPGTFGAAATAGTGLMMAGLGKLGSSKSSISKEKEDDEKSNKAEKEGSNGEDKNTPQVREKDFEEIQALLGREEGKFAISKEKRERQLEIARQRKEEAKEGLKTAERWEDKKQYRKLKRDSNKYINKYKKPNSIALKAERKKKIVKPKSTLRLGLEQKGKGLVKRYKSKGGLVKGTLRTVVGLKAGAIAATAGGIIGIATGDPSKVGQYFTTGAVGGYTLGKSGANAVSNAVTIPKTKEPEKQKQENKDNKEKYKDLKNKTDEKEVKKLLEEILKKETKDVEEVKKMIEEIRRDVTNEKISANNNEAISRVAKEMEISYKNQEQKKELRQEDKRQMSEKKKEYKEKMVKKVNEKDLEDKEKEIKEDIKDIDNLNKFKK